MFITLVTMLMVWCIDVSFQTEVSMTTTQPKRRLELKAVGSPKKVAKKPTAEQLGKVVDKLRQVNTSGDLMPGSNYQQYLDNKYIKFDKNGKWTLTDKGKQAIQAQGSGGGQAKKPAAVPLDKVVDKLRQVNTSGELMPGSNYQQYLDNKYIKFDKNGKWVLTDKGKQAIQAQGSGGGQAQGSGGGQAQGSGGGQAQGSGGGSVDSVKVLGGGTVISANEDQSKFCSDMFGGGGHYKNVKKCGSSNLGSMAYVEGATTGSGDMFKAAPDSAVKAAYFNMGTNNDIMKANSSGNISTTNQSGCLYGSEGGCIQWDNDSSRAAAVASAKKAIKQAVASGANTLRLDQLDVCEDNNGKTYSDKCSQGLRTALTEISQAANKAGLGIVGNNGWKAQQALIDAQNNGGAKVVGAMLDDSFSNMNTNLKDMRKIVGSDVPIFTAGY